MDFKTDGLVSAREMDVFFHRCHKPATQGEQVDLELEGLISKFNELGNFTGEKVSDDRLCQLDFHAFVELMLMEDPTEVLGIEMADKIKLLRKTFILSSATHELADQAGVSENKINPVTPDKLKSHALELVVASMIITNVAVIGVKGHSGNGSLSWFVCELLFAIFFTCELFYRLYRKGVIIGVGLTGDGTCSKHS